MQGMATTNTNVPRGVDAEEFSTSSTPAVALSAVSLVLEVVFLLSAIISSALVLSSVTEGLTGGIDPLVSEISVVSGGLCVTCKRRMRRVSVRKQMYS